MTDMNLVDIKPIQNIGSARPGTFEVTSPLTPAENLANQGLFDLTFGNFIGAIKVKRLIERDYGIDITMDSVAQRRSSPHVGGSLHGRDKPPARQGETPGTVHILLNIIVESLGGCRWNTEKDAVSNNRERHRRVNVFADQNVLLDVEIRGRPPMQLWHSSSTILSKTGVVWEQR